MKPLSAKFLSVLIIIFIFSSCQSRLSSSSSAEDSVSYAIGVLWGYQISDPDIKFVDPGDILNGLKEKIKNKKDTNNSAYEATIKLKNFKTQKKQEKYNEKQEKYVEDLISSIWADQLVNTKIPRINLNKTYRGIKDFLSGDTTKLQFTLTEASIFLKKYMQKMEDEENAKIKEEGEKFLKKNAKEQGVTTTNSGLQYKIIKKNNGKIADENDTIFLNITTKYISGDTIETSKNKAFVNNMQYNLESIYESFKIFGEGDKYTIYSPPKLAFGEKPDPWVSTKIKPNMVIIYDIEILKIIKPNKTQKK